MKKAMMIFFLLFIIVLAGCSNDLNITEAQAKDMVIDRHCRDTGGEVTIKSIFSKNDKYIVEWEIEPLEEGKDSIHKQTGDIKEIQSSHGTCRWF